MGRISFTAGIFFAFGILFVGPGNTPAQFYNRGQDPGRLKWEQIRTDHFRVIFPEDIRQEARRMTSILERYYEPNSEFLNNRPGRIPVVLHNRSVLSNGFVAWAPKRMELVTTPPATGFAQDHFEQLALHEFRHVVQVDKMRQGITRGLSYLIGEAGVGAVAGMMPFWFLEGDAVDAETRLSHSGRGRLPSFEMEIKAILADEPGLYPYEKAVFGSYRDFVPNHYRYGYQMVAHGRNKYGNELWENITDFTARKPYTLYPYYFGLKKYAGLSKAQFYGETFETLRTHWSEQTEGRNLTETCRINRPGKKHYTSYRFPRYLNDSLIFAEKTGIDQIPEFVAIDRAGKEERIHRPGFYDAANISLGGNRIAWEEIMYDPRWQRRTWSVIKIFDLDRKTERILQTRTRYFAPDLTEDGLFIAAVEADPQNRYFLVILNANTGEPVVRVPSPDNQYLQYPVWNDEKNRIYLTSLGEKGKKIIRYDVDNETWKTLFDAGFEDVAELDCRGKTLVFRGTFSGIDNIYALDLETNECQRITSSRFGAFTPSLSANGDTLVYADYTSQGYDVVKIPFEPSTFVPLAGVHDHQEQLNIPTREEESSLPGPVTDPKPYKIRKFRKYGNLFNFHSWAPLYADLDDPSIEELKVSPGLMLVSQNLLSTATTVLGYEYNLELRDHFFHASFTYSGLYPMIKFSLDYGGLSRIYPTSDTSINVPTMAITELSLRTRVFLPLNFTYNRYVMGAQPSVEASYNRSRFYYSDPGAWRSGLTYMDYRLYFYSYLKMGKRDIIPRFGLVLDLRSVNTPFEKEQLGSQFLGSGILYLPGILSHQSLKIFAGIQKQDTEKWVMQNLMSMPRGIVNHPAVRLKKITFDYVFPIAYPDWGLWRAGYFKRFRGAVFYDYAYGEDVYINRPVTRDFQSVGLELSTDMHLAQIFLPFKIGGRIIYVPETGTASGEFVFSVDLSQL